MDDVAIKVENVSKSFKLPHEKSGTVKNIFLNIFRHGSTYEKQEVLKNISFDIKKGEFFGIVGRNGSGKSTLLKLMARIYDPERGHIQINGKLTPFIELGVGFNPELTGRENVFLNGALLGFSRKEMELMYDEIVGFAELERFMEQKLKNYSSGMQVRLGFSIAIKANSDILILDEVLAVGDAAFQKKCYDYFSDLKENQKTVILVSHDMEAVQRFCTRALLLEKGKIVSTGLSQTVGDEYKEMFLKEIKTKTLTQNNSQNLFKLISATVQGGEDTIAVLKPNEQIKITMKLEALKDISTKVNYGLNILNSAGILVFATSTNTHSVSLNNLKKGQTVEITHKLPNYFTDDFYHVNIAIEDTNTKDIILKAARVCEFASKGWKIKHSLLQVKNNLSLKM